jgi:hypothetical protein
MISYVKFIKQAPDGPVTCRYLDIFGLRLLVAISSRNWYSSDKQRKVPLWVSRKGLFAWRVAARIGKRKEVV